MKKLLLAFVILSVVLCVVMTGCSDNKVKPNTADITDSLSDASKALGEAVNDALADATSVSEAEKVDTVGEYFALEDTKKAYDAAVERMKADYADVTYSAESDDTALFVYKYKEHYYSEVEDEAAEDIAALDPMILEAAQNTLLELKTYTTVENPKVIFRYLQPDGSLAFEKTFEGDEVFALDE